MAFFPIDSKQNEVYFISGKAENLPLRKMFLFYRVKFYFQQPEETLGFVLFFYIPL
jgi:hypothetical protein